MTARVEEDTHYLCILMWIQNRRGFKYLNIGIPITDLRGFTLRGRVVLRTGVKIK